MNPDFIADEKQKMNELNEEEPSLVKYVIKKEEFLPNSTPIELPNGLLPIKVQGLWFVGHTIAPFSI